MWWATTAVCNCNAASQTEMVVDCHSTCTPPNKTKNMTKQAHHKYAGHELLPLEELRDGPAGPPLEGLVDHQPVPLRYHQPRRREVLAADVGRNLTPTTEKMTKTSRLPMKLAMWS